MVVATPFASVVSVSEFVEVEAKVPLAPVVGAVKVTNAPLNGAPPMVTVATSGAENAVFNCALCGVPLVAAINSGGVLKLELLQLVKKTKASTTGARKIASRILPQAGRFIFIANPLSAPSCGWRARVPAARGGRRAGCGWYRSRCLPSRCVLTRLACL